MYVVEYINCQDYTETVQVAQAHTAHSAGKLTKTEVSGKEDKRV